MPALAILCGGLAVQLLAREPHRARRAAGGPEQPDERLAQRRLAHAVAPDQRDGLGAHRQRHALEHVRACRSSRRGSRPPAAGQLMRDQPRSEVEVVHGLVGRGSRPACPPRSRAPSCIIVTHCATRSATSMSCSIRISVIESSSPSSISVRLHALGAREAGGRLVEHQQLRVRAQRHADLQLALLAVREVGDERAEAAREPDRLGHRPRLLAQLAVALGRHHPQVPVARRRARRDRGCPRPRGRGTAATSGTSARGPCGRACGPAASVTSSPKSSTRPLLGGNSPGDQVEERRLAGAVGPEDGPALAGPYLEVHVAHGVDAAEAAVDPPQAEDRRGARQRMSRSCHGSP